MQSKKGLGTDVIALRDAKDFINISKYLNAPEGSAKMVSSKIKFPVVAYTNKEGFPEIAEVSEKKLLEIKSSDFTSTTVYELKDFWNKVKQPHLK